MQHTGTFVPIAEVTALREGFLSTHEIEGRAVVVATTAAGIHVYDGTCPHADFQFGAARLRRGCEIECQMHGARFTADETGEVTKGPAKEPLWVLESRVVDGVVEVLVDW
ncbi:Rieske (2Fe-2S) protein [Amycolatopsis rhabdoformis]|uniref:Rieske (2Fe-2S) protein n=1 Tax=Amycolatopsis rhabdoformis TaxID=1448059 RepID=A0ABZ1IGE3_9PSEU|nr:Rieske (2Fe-2S) protein [Amycolatopsis rhabdoformis]WSE33540.1 Rieske (2Fe-2S) protein [Amycolatopsis rhabdoformis]